MKELLQLHALIHSLDIDPLPEEHVKASITGLFSALTCNSFKG